MVRYLAGLGCAIVLIALPGTLSAQAAPIDCIVVAQYSHDTPEEDHNKGIANNNDLMVSAKAFQKDDKDSDLKEINSSATLEKASVSGSCKPRRMGVLAGSTGSAVSAPGTCQAKDCPSCGWGSPCQPLTLKKLSRTVACG